MTSNRDESESIILTGCVKKFVPCDEDNFSHQTPYLHLDIPNPHLEVLFHQRFMTNTAVVLYMYSSYLYIVRQ